MSIGPRVNLLGLQPLLRSDERDHQIYGRQPQDGVALIQCAGRCGAGVKLCGAISGEGLDEGKSGSAELPRNIHISTGGLSPGSSLRSMILECTIEHGGGLCRASARLPC